MQLLLLESGTTLLPYQNCVMAAGGFEVVAGFVKPSAAILGRVCKAIACATITVCENHDVRAPGSASHHVGHDRCG